MAVSDISYEYTSPTIIMVPTICYVFVMKYPSLSLRDTQDPSHLIHERAGLYYRQFGSLCQDPAS